MSFATMATDNSISWTNDLIFKLIDLYYERALLWDTNLREYKDKKKKNDAWAEIAVAMGMDKDAVERKIKILSTQFRREIVKNDNDESKWFAFRKLMFLKPRVLKALADTRDTESNTRDEDWSISQSSATPTTSSCKLSVSTPQIRVKRMRVSETESEDISTKTEETYRIMAELYRERVSRDEFTVFGEHVAVKLRKLDNLYARCTAQYHINNILYRAEIGEYDTLEDSKPYLG